MAQKNPIYLMEGHMSNEKVRELIGQQLLGDIIRERRLRWCGHVWRMTTYITARAAISWFPTDYKRKRGRPRIDWIQTISKTSTEEVSNGRIFLG